MTVRIAVLASGGGSNLQAILDYQTRLGEARAGTVVLVASNRASAGALDRARQAGIPAEHIDPGNPEALLTILRSHRIDLVVLAGYLKLIPAAVIAQFHGRMINVHPGPLPAFGGAGMYGARVHGAVLAAGATHSGVTVHFVDEQFDHGAVIAHWPVPVYPEDTAESLGARVLNAEHLVFPRIVDMVAASLELQFSSPSSRSNS